MRAARWWIRRVTAWPSIPTTLGAWRMQLAACSPVATNGSNGPYAPESATNSNSLRNAISSGWWKRCYRLPNVEPMDLCSLAVVVLTYNEELNLPACLASVQGLSPNLVVVDSGSTDRTLAIAA